MPIRILLILSLLLKTQNLGTYAQQIEEQSQNLPADDQPSPQAGSDWYRDEAPPPSSIINSDSTQLESPSANPPARAFGARTYDSPAVQPQFVDRKYRPANPPPAWNPPAAQPQYVPGGPAQSSPNKYSGPEPPTGRFNNWENNPVFNPPNPPFVNRAENPYQAPAQRPPEETYSAGGGQQPQLSFRTPSEQYSPVSSSSSVTLPGTPQGIAYYLPNQPNSQSQASQDQYGGDTDQGGQYPSSYSKRPPVLSIGNFPPSSGNAGRVAQPPAQQRTFPYVPTPYPPNPPTVPPYPTPAPPSVTPEQYRESITAKGLHDSRIL
ncbi:hypothetical protein DdX_09821 [Ditylenchus destructor]|uniref:Uncharacterized protein n=1 Tax=Ditylenchus destructor TaxID=166010 RepID=A0AAD4N3C9_9BILA|nr:hypothetical protein DdX_09821 [Ditylenchus destructor]